MHIPDGFLSTGISLIMYSITILTLSTAFRKSKKAQTLDERKVPFFSVIAATIFAAQMLNFSLIAVGGTSGHFLGAALSAIIFGPVAAMIIMTLVVAVQAIFFADGGILALGANLFNMAIAGPIVSYAVYKTLSKKNNTSAITLAAWSGVMAAAISCSIELGLSGTIPMKTALLAMTPIHAVIGIGEALITLGIISYIRKTRPEILKREKEKNKKNIKKAKK